MYPASPPPTGYQLERSIPPLSLRLHAIAGLSILPLPVLVGFSIHAARMAMLAVFAGADGDPSERATTALSRGMAGQIVPDEVGADEAQAPGYQQPHFFPWKYSLAK